MTRDQTIFPSKPTERIHNTLIQHDVEASKALKIDLHTSNEAPKRKLAYDNMWCSTGLSHSARPELSQN